jgi:hypothetical protein
MTAALITTHSSSLAWRSISVCGSWSYIANQVEEMMRVFYQKSGNNRKFGYSNLILVDAVNKTTTCWYRLRKEQTKIPKS